jgi:hypothetical protein
MATKAKTGGIFMSDDEFGVAFGIGSCYPRGGSDRSKKRTTLMDIRIHLSLCSRLKWYRLFRDLNNASLLIALERLRLDSNVPGLHIAYDSIVE